MGTMSKVDMTIVWAVDWRETDVNSRRMGTRMPGAGTMPEFISQTPLWWTRYSRKAATSLQPGRRLWKMSLDSGARN